MVRCRGSSVESILIIHPTNVEDVWGELGPWVIQAMNDGVEIAEVEEIKESCKHGSRQLIVVGDGVHTIELVLVTETFFYAGRKTMAIIYGSGRLGQDWSNWLAKLENYVAGLGFERIQVRGRLGWLRKLKPEGYELEHVLLSKSLLRGLN